MKRARTGTTSLLLAFLLAIGLPAGVLLFLSGHFAQIYVWKKEVSVVRSSQDSAATISKMFENGLVVFDHLIPEFHPDPCEALIDEQVPHNGDLKNGFIRGVLEDFCQSVGGQAIGDEIAEWNASFVLLAIRDNFASDFACADDNRNAGRVITLGCHPAKWQVTRIPDASGRSAAVLTNRRFPPHRAFAHIARRGGLRFSDWLMVSNGEASADPGARQEFVLSSRLRSNGGPGFVDVIGKPSELEINGEKLVIGDLFSTGNLREFTLGGTKGSIILLCGQSGPEGNQPYCGSALQKREAHSWRIQLSSIPKDREVEISIHAGFSHNLPEDLLAFNSAVEKKSITNGVKLKRSDHLGIECSFDGAVVCKPEWTVSERKERLERKRYRLLLSDGRELIDAKGRTTSLSFELGLSPLVGFSSRDNGSLSAGLAALELIEDTDFSLTIDPDIQSAALKSIVGAIEKYATSAYRRANARGAIVMIDAGDDASTRGDILAAASVPQFQSGLNEWDLVALAEAGGAANPLAGHAWRQTDVHSTPGSSFKTVTGLAGIEAAIADQSLADLILGDVRPEEVRSRLGATGDQLVVKDAGIEDYTISGGFSKAVKSPASSGCPAGRSAADQISLCEALIVSSNPWFAGLNLAIDGAVAGKKNRGMTSNLAKVVGRMFPLLTPEDRGKGGCVKCIDLTWGAIPDAGRARLEAIDIPMISNEVAGRIDIALNSFGQGVRAAPMAMTSLYASIASGRVVIPRVVREGKESGFEFAGQPVPSQRTEFTERGMASLRAGLKGVLDAPYGTATRRLGVNFQAYSGNVFGKTGTADTEDNEANRLGLTNSVSFSGWVGPEVNLKRRIAFTCWMSHLPAGEFGGTVCAPLVSDVLNAIPAR